MQELTQNNVGVRKRGGVQVKIPGHTLSRVGFMMCLRRSDKYGRERRGHPNQEEGGAVLQAPAVELRQAGYGLTETVMLKGWQNMPSHSIELAQAVCPGTVPSTEPGT